VQNIDRYKLRSFHFKYCIFMNGMKVYLGYAGIFFLREYIWKLSVNSALHSLCCIHVNFLFQNEIESADIIKTRYMIFVFVRKNNCVKLLYIFTKYLVTKIRIGINYKNFFFVFNHN